jgi:SAM-dependent methyltransferase
MTRSPSSEQLKEGFQPIAVTSPARNPLLFRLRCLIDLQLGTIVQKLRPALTQVSGKVLDVGAGQSPWRAWLPSAASYQGIDVGYADEFGMDGNRADIVYYDGGVMPFDDAAFDWVLCIEVLEHSEDPQFLLSEIARVLRPEGTVLLTVPFSARLHHLPHDYHRFTHMRLEKLFSQNGFGSIEIAARGNDIGAIANKLTVLTIRLLCLPLSPRKALHVLWSYPVGLVTGVLAVCFIAAAHISVALGMGSDQDPLGYFVRAKRHRQ